MASEAIAPTSYGNIYRAVNISGHAHVQLGDNYTGTASVQTQYQQFLQSLDFPELLLREESVTQAHEGTFEWIFSSIGDDNHTWLPLEPWMMSESHNMYWIEGKAGSGKSTLLGFLCEHNRSSTALQAWAQSEQLLLLKHFFWDHGAPMQRSLQGLLRSLLWQFFYLEQEEGLRVWKRALDSSQTHARSSQLLTRTLETVLSLQSFKFCLFIDGLDECSDQDDLLRLLQKLELLESVKICVSSRPERKFQVAFSPTSSRHVHVLHLDKMTHRDMQKFAQDELLSVHARGVPGSMLRQEDIIMRLLPRLLSKAQGVFRWLSVAVSSLKEGIEYDDEWSVLVERLKEMPEDVFHLYIQMIARGRDNLKRYASNAASIMKFLLHTDEDERLSLPGLAWAMNAALRHQLFDSDISYASLSTFGEQIELESLKVRIPSRCANLVEVRMENTELARPHSLRPLETTCFFTRMIQPEQPVVRFIHSTVREFLTETPEGRQLTAGCTQNSNDIKKSFLQSDLVLLLYHASHADRASRSNQGGLQRHLELITDMNIYYNHWRLVEKCIGKVRFPIESDMWYVNYLWVSKYEKPSLPPRCEDGWLYWCVCNAYHSYVRSAVADLQRPRSAPALVRLLCVIIRSCALGISGYRIVTAADAKRLTDDVSHILATGSCLNSSIGIPGRDPLHRWTQKFCVLSYCLYMISFSASDDMTLHALQDIALLLLEAGATFSVSPPSLQEIFLHPHLDAMGDDEIFCLIQQWDPLARIRRHRPNCSNDHCTTTATSLINRIEGSRVSSGPSSQLLMFYLDDQRLYTIHDDDRQTLLDLMDMHLNVLDNVSRGQSEEYQLYPSIIEIPFYYLNYIGQERLDAILSRGYLIASFEDVLRTLAWSEEDIKITFDELELRHWHGPKALR